MSVTANLLNKVRGTLRIEYAELQNEQNQNILDNFVESRWFLPVCIFVGSFIGIVVLTISLGRFGQ